MTYRGLWNQIITKRYQEMLTTYYRNLSNINPLYVNKLERNQGSGPWSFLHRNT